MNPARPPKQDQAGTYAPLVSIITPTFQHQAFIEACLQSVLAQDYRNWELFVIDDASTDGTPGIVSAYSTRDSRIQLIRHETNYGVERLNDTYNEALAKCRGELVAVLEGDDEWLPGKLSNQVPVFRDPRVVLCYADYDQVTEDGRLIARHQQRDAIGPGRSGPRQNLGYFSLLKSFGSDTVVVRRAELLAAGGFISAGLPLVDYPTWLRLATRGDFVRVPLVLGRWRRHKGSVYYAHEYAVMERLREHFISYLQSESASLSAQGVTAPDCDIMKKNAVHAVHEKNRSRHYYEGKYHLLFGNRLKALGPFSRAMVHPETPLRHRAGALIGMMAATTSPRLVLQLARIRQAVRPQSPFHPLTMKAPNQE